MDIVKQLKKIAKYAETSPGCFSIDEKNLAKVEDDINKLLKYKILENYYEKSEDIEKNINEYGTLWFVLTEKGINELKKIRDKNELSEKEYNNIIEILGR